MKRILGEKENTVDNFLMKFVLMILWLKSKAEMPAFCSSAVLVFEKYYICMSRAVKLDFCSSFCRVMGAFVRDVCVVRWCFCMG